jgi:hypothetical protein
MGIEKKTRNSDRVNEVDKLDSGQRRLSDNSALKWTAD